MVVELVRPANSARRRLHELATHQEVVRIYFRASRGVSLVAEFDKVRSPFTEKLLLTTENHHIDMVVELVRPANFARRRLHELATCPEVFRIYFRASRDVFLVAVFDKERSQFT